MAPKNVRLLTAMALLALLAPATATAGPFLGAYGWCWRPARDCPRRDYSPLHYWAPELYQARAYVHPSNLDQYPPGPAIPIPATFEFNKYRCPSTPPTLTSPYADPNAYYGRQVSPE